MTLLQQNGHLSEQALLGLAEGSLCTAQRLQAAEHLTVCDLCLLRLTDMDAAQLPLQTPPHDLAQPTVHRLRRAKVVAFVQRCGVVAAAACFAVAGWQFDFFGKVAELPRTLEPGPLQQFSVQLSEGLFGWGDDISQFLQDTFGKAPLGA